MFEPVYCNIERASLRLGVSKKTLYAWLSNDRIFLDKIALINEVYKINPTLSYIHAFFSSGARCAQVDQLDDLHDVINPSIDDKDRSILLQYHQKRILRQSELPR